MSTVLLYYHFVEIKDPESLVANQRALCERLGLKGRLLIGTEGLNGTLAGEPDAVEEYKREVWADSRFTSMLFKESPAEENPFPKLKVKLRNEIISLHEEVDLTNKGAYITPDELHALYESEEEFYVIDTRNMYESIEGTFANAIAPDIKNFRDLPELVDQYTELKDKKVVTCCTGGIRCEKASSLLRKKGFKNVYQLEGGIVSYIMKYPNQYFQGDCYVFDNRMRMNQSELAKHGVVSQAPQYQAPQP